jgi:hypothetical protein
MLKCMSLKKSPKIEKLNFFVETCTHGRWHCHLQLGKVSNFFNGMLIFGANTDGCSNFMVKGTSILIDQMEKLNIHIFSLRIGAYPGANKLTLSCF